MVSAQAATYKSILTPDLALPHHDLPIVLSPSEHTPLHVLPNIYDMGTAASLSQDGDTVNSEVVYKYFLASIIETSRDPIISVDEDLSITSWNNAAADLYGYTAEEAVGRKLTSLTLDKDLQMICAKVKMVLSNERVEVFDTNRIGKDDKRLNLEVVMSPVKDGGGEIVGVSTIAHDITIRRQAEKAHRDRDLLRRVLSVQEDERSRLARDLHDELGQSVTALRFMLRSAKDKGIEREGQLALTEMEQLIEVIDRNIDFISWQLRPAALDSDPSLTSAINNFTRQWSRQTGIPVKRVAALSHPDHLLSAVDTNLYRIVQEALNNIQKHAKATKVEISLTQSDEYLVLVISDNGKGFNIDTTRRSRQGFGLVGMKERAALIDACFEIVSSRGEGTTIHVRVPNSAE
jgi:PAS domain S-box-containing protein